MPAKSARSTQWKATPHRRPIAESTPSGGITTAASVTTRLTWLVASRTVAIGAVRTPSGVAELIDGGSQPSVERFTPDASDLLRGTNNARCASR